MMKWFEMVFYTLSKWQKAMVITAMIGIMIFFIWLFEVFLRYIFTQ